PAFEGGGQPQLEDLGGQARRHDPATHGQDVGVVVLPAQPGGEQVVAQGGAHAVDLVGGDLLALAGAAEHDPALSLAVHDGAPDGGADGRVVDGLGGVGAEVEHLVAQPLELGDEVDLQVVPGVVRSDGDPH